MAMLKYIQFILFCFIFSEMNSQCLTDFYYQKAIEKNPSIEQQASQFYQSIQHFSNTQRAAKIIIPVVFHVIHTNGVENISKAQIKDAIRLLNLAFSNNHPNKGNIRAPFKSIASNCEIEFRLAQIDPNGQCTDGINRIYSPLHLSATDEVKNIAGARWDNSKYLNIWTASFIEHLTPGGQGVAGYSYLPYSINGSNDPIDGVVILHNCIGTIGTGRADLMGGTLTHEVGHYLGLIHTFNGGCFGSDYCDDTPPVANEFTNGGCPSNGNSCKSDNPDLLDQWENYMDYSGGACQSMFSSDQRDIMRSTFTSFSFRANMVSLNNLKVTGVELSNQSPIAFFTSNTRTACIGEAVTYYNTACRALPTSVLWDFEGANLNSANKDTVTVYYNKPGKYKVSLNVSNAFGSDLLTAEDYIEIRDRVAPIKPALLQGFEAVDWLNTSGWEIWKQGDDAFKVDQSVAYSGSKCLIAPINNMAYKSQLYELVSPPIDLRPLKGLSPKISMMAAYIRQSTSSTEKLRLYMSRGCGDVWELLFQKGANSLSYNSSIYQSNFKPKNKSEWQLLSHNLSAYENDSNVRFKIQVESGENNSVYIDDINISNYYSGIDETEQAFEVQIFPNPATRFLSINYQNESGTTEVWLENMLGQKIVQVMDEQSKYGVIAIDFKQNDTPLIGVYILKIRANNQVISKKLIFAN
jgi:PKD repeat protein